MRRATTEIVERVERLEKGEIERVFIIIIIFFFTILLIDKERCAAPDVTEMLRGYAIHEERTREPRSFSPPYYYSFYFIFYFIFSHNLQQSFFSKIKSS